MNYANLSVVFVIDGYIVNTVKKRSQLKKKRLSAQLTSQKISVYHNTILSLGKKAADLSCKNE